MINFYSSIGLLGESGLSHGCAILTAINDRGYLITAAHITTGLMNSNAWFQTRLMKTKFPAAGFFRYPFNVVQRVPDVDLSILQTSIIPGGEYLEFCPDMPLPGSKLYAYGYPVSEVVKDISKGIDEPLTPYQLPGEFTGFKDQILLKGKYEIPDISVYNIGIMQTESSDFAGYSGGLVTDQEDRPIGLIVGENGNHLLFIHVQRALK